MWFNRQIVNQFEYEFVECFIASFHLICGVVFLWHIEIVIDTDISEFK